MAAKAVSSLSFSFRPQDPPRPAADLLAEIRSRGGRVYRMRAERVICVTDDVTLAEWLHSIGAGHPIAYPRSPEKIEWDVTINGIQVDGSIWEAAA